MALEMGLKNDRLNKEVKRWQSLSGSIWATIACAIYWGMADLLMSIWVSILRSKPLLPSKCCVSSY
jgi:hypothetical protein